MKANQKLSPEDRAFLADVRALEERLHPDLLDPEYGRRLRSVRGYREFRPSHHVSRGLVGRADLAAWSVPGRRILSIGAYPARFEALLCALGLPAENLVVSDRDPAILEVPGEMRKVAFDLLDPWPPLGTFDAILLPESLAMALGQGLPPPEGGAPHASDPVVARRLADVIGQALDRLRPEGELRADGPMPHPNVVRAASGLLDTAGRPHRIRYERFFLWVRASDGPSECRFG